MTLPGVAALALSYLSGSIPSASLAGKARGVDLRKHGSGNLGATNVVRVLGGRIGTVVFVADMLKGFLPTWFLPGLVDPSHAQLWAIAIGVAAIGGHVRPLFLGFAKGGKGVATAAGVFLALAWLPTLVVLAIWSAAFLVTRYVSVASLVAVTALPLVLYAWHRDVSDPLFLIGLAMTAFVFITHRGNIRRLRRGEEHRFVRPQRADGNT